MHFTPFYGDMRVVDMLTQKDLLCEHTAKRKSSSKPSTSVYAPGQFFFSVLLCLFLVSPCSTYFGLFPVFFPCLLARSWDASPGIAVNPVYFTVHCFPLRALAGTFLGSLPLNNNSMYIDNKCYMGSCNFGGWETLCPPCPEAVFSSSV